MNNLEQFEGFKIKDMNELTADYRKLIIEEYNSTENEINELRDSLKSKKEVFYK